MRTFKQNDFLNYEYATGLEWLETNGLGGWSGSSVAGSQTRRYHGLLIAAIVPPTERMNLVSKLEETIIVDQDRFELSSNLYPNETIHPRGFQYIQQFKKEYYPEWIFEAAGVVIKKQVIMVHRENTVLVVYDVLDAPSSCKMEFRPFLATRGYHSLQKANDSINLQADFANDTLKAKPYQHSPEIFIQVPDSQYSHDPNWFYDFIYSAERERGLDFKEDLFVPGVIQKDIQKGDRFIVIVSTEDPVGRNSQSLLDNEVHRRENLLEKPFSGQIEQILTLAAEQFVVKRDENLKTVIAGYPWFTDWSRDTMISLPGLTLYRKEFEDARKILAAFSRNVSQGMLPNRFQDNNEEPEYNTVDGTLWYFIAIHKYLEVTGDTEFVLKELLPVLKEIIDWHFKGTRFNIHVDKDGLLFSGESGQQLTWMDARIGNWVVTPRMGKPVEIQALWYNALLIFANLLEKNNQAEDASIVRLSAAHCKNSFVNRFWYSNGGYLYDNIDFDGVRDNTLRPNQLLAISLPFPLIEGAPAQSVLDVIERELYTPVGLRTLPRFHPEYRSTYGGDILSRDSAYHQGTVWSWLVGPYIDAIMRVNKEGAGKEKAENLVIAFGHHLEEACVGSVSEIFDAEYPHHSKGCVAQAWGVAEVLRVIKEYNLGRE